VRRAVFLDRDGVLTRMVYRDGEGWDSPYRPEEVDLMPGVGPALRALKEVGFALVVVSNQPGVAKGTCSLETLAAVSHRFVEALHGEGIALDGLYYCLHHPEGVVPPYNVPCECRKPRPGLLLRASEELGLDLRASYLVGDRSVDIAAGQAVGCRTVLVTGSPAVDLARPRVPVRPDFIARNLMEAVERILEHEGHMNWRD